jgi:hypothetical protein
MFLSPIDFTGKYEISTGMYDTNKLQDYIDRYEPSYLRQLFGVTMYNEFIADLDVNNLPQSPNYLKLYYPFAEDVTPYNLLESRGLLDMLKGFIYFEYYKDLVNLATPYGGVKPNAENSTIVGTTSSTMYTRYNDAVKTYKAIRHYIHLNTPVETGQLVAVSIANAGTGYVTGTNILVPYSTTPIYVGGVDTFTPTALGTGYTSATGVVVNGGTGTGLIVDIVDDGAGGIATITIVDAGTGYTMGDSLIISGGNNDATINVDSVTYTSQITTPPANGVDATIDIEATPIGGIESTALLTAGTGYTAGIYPVTGGTGAGAMVEISDDGLGGVSSVTILEAGAGYTILDVLTIDGGNQDATIEVSNILIGEITSVTINTGGLYYAINDLLDVSAGNNDAQLLVTYVGIGDYKNFNGVEKLYTYWI